MNNFITAIEAHSFKGSSFVQPLTRCTVISGGNALGKSSRIEAAILGLTGMIPGLPKTGSGIFAALASGNPLTVELELSQGAPIHREWREMRGSVKYIGTGDDLEFPISCLDASEFLSMTGPQRTAHLFSRAKLPDSFKIPALVASITANVKNIKLEENTAETEAVLSQICSSICDSGVPVQPPQDFISMLAASFKEQLRLANENARRMTATVAGLSQIKESGNGNSDVEQRLGAARKELETVNAEVSRLKQVGVQLKSEITEKMQLSAASVNLPAPQEPGTKPEPKQLHTRRPTDTAEAAAFDAATVEARKIGCAVEDLEAEVRALEDSVNAAKTTTNCPVCGHDISEKQKSIIAVLNKNLTTAKRSLKSARSVQALKDTVAAKAQAAFKAAHDAIGAWDKANFELLAQNQTVLDAYNKRVAAWNDYQASVNRNSAASVAAAALPDLRQKIESVRAEYNAALQLAVQKQSVVTELDMERNKLIQQRAEAASRAKSIAEAEHFKAEAMVLKEVVKLIEALKEEVVKQSIQPLVDKCNEFCGPILVNPIAFQEGEIGMIGKTGFYGNKTMSDSEKMLCYAALSIALASESPFRLAILARFEAFDWMAKPKVIHRVMELITEGKIDQCICIEVAALLRIHGCST